MNGDDKKPRQRRTAKAAVPSKTKIGINSNTSLDISSFVDSSPLAITLLDGDGRVLVWSKKAEELFGWKAEEVLGKHPPFVSNEKKDEFTCIHSKAMKGRTQTGRRVTRQKKDGSSVDLSMSTSPVRDFSGAIIGVLGVMTDITEHLQQKRQF